MFDLIPFERRQRNLANYFDQMEKNFFRDFGSSLPDFKTDILDKGDHYLLQAELPGFAKEDIHIDLDGDRMTISATHTSEKEESKENFVTRERSYGSYTRSFDISNINSDAISATYNNGVLELNLPKKVLPEKTSRKVEIE